MPAQVDREKVRNVIGKAEKAARAKKWQKALDFYLEGSKLDPTNDRVMRRVGDVYLKMGNEGDAMAQYKKLAALYAKNGFWAKSISVYKIVLDFAPEDASIQAEIAELYANLGITQPAVTEDEEESKSSEVQRDATPASESNASAQEEASLELDAPGCYEPGVKSDDADFYNTCVTIFDLEDDSDSPESESPAANMPAKAPGVSQPDTSGAQAARQSMASASSAVSDPMELLEEVDDIVIELDDEVVELDDVTAPVKTVKVPLFSDLQPKEFTALLTRISVRKVPSGGVVCKQGQRGDSVYVVVSGTADVFINDEKGDDVLVGQVNPAEFFGEFGMLSDGIRHATVKAKSRMELFEFTKRDLKAVIKKYPRVLKVLDLYYRERIVQAVIGKTPIFKGLEPREINSFVHRLQLQKIPENSYLFKEGDQGGDLFFIKSGTFEVSIKRDNDVVVIAQLDAGDFFGEIALITGKPRTATIRSVDDGEVLKMSQSDAEDVFTKHPEIRTKLEQIVLKRAEDAIAAFQSHEELKKNLALV